ncbi:MAG TPA: efflux RND transporter permease subunit [Gemmatimonadales bacterium]|nr:efflux RND transporter permease subunit [Gemmatimonadales bacterium]
MPQPAIIPRPRIGGGNSLRFTTLFIKRPVMTTLLTAGILVFGVVAYRRLPVSDLPTVDYPTINVSASLPGASPQTMAATVATPLEKAFSAIAGLDNVTSTSTLGSTQITLQFSLDRDIDAAAQDVNAAISQALVNLPSNIIPPSYRKQNPAAAPILFLALTSSVVPLSTLDEYGETTIAQRLSIVDGVAQVAVYGAQKYAVRIQLDPAALANRGLTINDVARAVRSENVLIPTGVLYGTNRTLTVQATGQLTNAPQFRRLVVAYRNGAPVHLDEVANVFDDVQNNKAASWYNADRAIVLAVQRQPGTNTVAVATAVKQVLADLSHELPPSVAMNIRYDRSVSIEAAVRDVKNSLLLALVLVVAVIFLFLRSLVATLIPSLTLPMAIVGTFSVMALLSFSIDNLSLMALTLAVGFVVDDAIVMLENIVRHLEMGKPPLAAAIEGAAEVGFTIISMTLSLAAVFIPLVFMGGIVGRLFREFAITISAAILVSGFVSLTLTPMLCSRFLKPDRDKQHGRWYNLTERGFEKLLHGYERSLAWAMAHRPAGLVFSLLILVLTGVLFVVVPKGLFPSDDTGLLMGTTEAAQGTSYQEMVRLQLLAAAAAARDPYVQGFMSSVGSGGPSSASNQGGLFFALTPASTRPRADKVAAELSRRLSGIPGLAVFIQNPPSIRMGGRSSKSLYQFTLQSSDVNALYSSAQQLMVKMRQLPGVTDVTTDMLNQNPQVTVQIDRTKAAQLGVTPMAVEQALASAFNEQQVSTIYTTSNEYWVVMEVEPRYQQDESALDRLYVQGTGGRPVLLADIAKFEQSVGPLSINHSGQLPSVTISFNLAQGVSLGTAVTTVQQLARTVLPGTITTGFSGTAQAFQSSQQGLGVLLLITIFVIYVILGILYESFVHPVTILSGLPFAAFGALLALFVTRIELNVYGYVGMIMLIGIVKKNAIMMIDFAIARERSEHVPPEKAIVEAASVRFRPIMMTTVAAIAGSLPIAIGIGASAASRRPLGVVVVGGLVFSQIVTLYITPVFYTYLDELQSWLGTLGHARNPAATEPAVS